MVLRDVQVFIIDGISMVGQTMLESIDERLRDMFYSTKPFGGKSLLVFGDFLQIAPVHSVPLYSSTIANQNGFATLFGTRIWDLFSVHRLTQIMRQRDNIMFAIALNNMARGETTPQDIVLLQSRSISLTNQQKQQMRNQGMTVSPLENNERGRPVCLHHWNKFVKLHNRITLESMD